MATRLDGPTGATNGRTDGRREHQGDHGAQGPGAGRPPGTGRCGRRPGTGRPRGPAGRDARVTCKPKKSKKKVKVTCTGPFRDGEVGEDRPRAHHEARHAFALGRAWRTPARLRSG